jgi:hypothetical protein
LKIFVQIKKGGKNLHERKEEFIKRSQKYGHLLKYYRGDRPIKFSNHADIGSLKFQRKLKPYASFMYFFP